MARHHRVADVALNMTARAAEPLARSHRLRADARGSAVALRLPFAFATLDGRFGRFAQPCKRKIGG